MQPVRDVALGCDGYFLDGLDVEFGEGGDGEEADVVEEPARGELEDGDPFGEGGAVLCDGGGVEDGEEAFEVEGFDVFEADAGEGGISDEGCTTIRCGTHGFRSDVPSTGSPTVGGISNWCERVRVRRYLDEDARDLPYP